MFVTLIHSPLHKEKVIHLLLLKMQESVVPVEVLDICFSYCDFQTQLQIKKLCHFLNNRYSIKILDPIKLNKITCEIYYHNKKIYNFKITI